MHQLATAGHKPREEALPTVSSGSADGGETAGSDTASVGPAAVW